MDNPFCGTSASLAEAGHSNKEATCRHKTSTTSLVRHGPFPRASLLQLPGVFGINRDPCSASAEISVRLRRKSAFGLPLNGRSASPVPHNLAQERVRRGTSHEKSWGRAANQ